MKYFFPGQLQQSLLQNPARNFSGVCRILQLLILIFASILSLVQFSCAPKLRNIYPDSYYTEDKVYQNRAVGFLLTFRGSWNINADPSNMKDAARSLAHSLQKSGAELLFAGTTSDGRNGVRAIADELNANNRDYAFHIRKANSADISEDLGLVPFIAGKNELLKWEYLIDGFHFIEFFFVSDIFNVRIAFWTTKELYTNMEPIYESIINSLTLTGE